MNDLTTNRTPSVIAAEINTIKFQTGRILLTGAIEIGRRLREAKSLLPHGEWGKWLEESFSYTQKTAGKLMRIFEAYGTCGSEQPASLNTDAQTQALLDLNYTQAFILLGVPEEERTQFLTEINVENMSTRELQKVVKERNQAFKERDQAFQEKADLQKALDDQVSQLTQLTTERDSLKTKAAELNKSQREILTKAGHLQSELTSLKKSTAYEGLQRMNKNLTAATDKACSNKVAFLFESLDRTYKQLNWELGKLAAKDAAAHETYKNKLLDFLVRSLKEKK